MCLRRRDKLQIVFGKTLCMQTFTRLCTLRLNVLSAGKQGCEKQLYAPKLNCLKLASKLQTGNKFYQGWRGVYRLGKTKTSHSAGKIVVEKIGD